MFDIYGVAANQYFRTARDFWSRVFSYNVALLSYFPKLSNPHSANQACVKKRDHL